MACIIQNSLYPKVCGTTWPFFLAPSHIERNFGFTIERSFIHSPLIELKIKSKNPTSSFQREQEFPCSKWVLNNMKVSEKSSNRALGFIYFRSEKMTERKIWKYGETLCLDQKLIHFDSKL